MWPTSIEDKGRAMANVDGGGSGFDRLYRGDPRRPLPCRAVCPQATTCVVDGLEGHIKCLGGAVVSLGAASRRVMARAMPTVRTGAEAVCAARGDGLTTRRPKREEGRS